TRPARTLEETRGLMFELSPPILEQEGLGDALEWLRRQMAELHGLEVTLERDADAPIPDEDRRLLLFQIVRELLFNVRKHAGTRRATVWLGAADGAVTIDVRDAGRGFDPRTLDRTDATGLGLVSIRERLRQIGGTLDVRSAPGEGARIVVSAPRVHEG
ncbi:MAG TPA: ATP-binding protein, partial [Sandaracinaceae bacterium LLY-WYZ-13_1]|nr:ATP-binding protein [Sandaracinaceae bacterium LLY-WYZ-13_1]